MYHKLTYKIPVIVKVRGEDDTDTVDKSLSTNVRVLDICCASFNSDNIGEYLVIELESCRMRWDKSNYDLLVDCIVSDDVYNSWDGSVSEYLLARLTGQMADGWGEGFEQFSYSLGNKEVYISLWDKEQPIIFIGESWKSI